MHSSVIARRVWITALVVAGALAGHAQSQDHVDVPRDQWQRVEDIFRELGATSGAHIADIGAGHGYFTTRLAKAVGTSGRVYAVDVNPVSLRELKDVLGSSYPNVEIIRGDENDPHLPPARLDGALVVNAYHEFAEHPAMLRQIRAALKPAGRLVLVEPIPRATDEPRAAQAKRHTIAMDLVEAELLEEGFEIVTRDPAFASRPAHSRAESVDGSVRATDWLITARRAPGASSYLAPSDQR
jgi:predicted methyltransferase